MSSCAGDVFGKVTSDRCSSVPTVSANAFLRWRGFRERRFRLLLFRSHILCQRIPLLARLSGSLSPTTLHPFPRDLPAQSFVGETIGSVTSDCTPPVSTSCVTAISVTDRFVCVAASIPSPSSNCQRFCIGHRCFPSRNTDRSPSEHSCGSLALSTNFVT
jgi:hypothetical protein